MQVLRQDFQKAVEKDWPEGFGSNCPHPILDSALVPKRRSTEICSSRSRDNWDQSLFPGDLVTGTLEN